jgi:hypothetical protein
MKTQINPLDLLKKFFRENSPEEVKNKLSKYETKSFSGPTVEQYFDEFNEDFLKYHDDIFQTICEANGFDIERYCKEILIDKALISKDFVIVKPAKDLKSDFIAGENTYALAA